MTILLLFLLFFLLFYFPFFLWKDLKEKSIHRRRPKQKQQNTNAWCKYTQYLPNNTMSTVGRCMQNIHFGKSAHTRACVCVYNPRDRYQSHNNNNNNTRKMTYFFSTGKKSTQYRIIIFRSADRDAIKTLLKKVFKKKKKQILKPGWSDKKKILFVREFQSLALVRHTPKYYYKIPMLYFHYIYRELAAFCPRSRGNSSERFLFFI